MFIYVFILGILQERANGMNLGDMHILDNYFLLLVLDLQNFLFFFNENINKII